jgi:ADP-ribosylglycohydrolase
VSAIAFDCQAGVIMQSSSKVLSALMGVCVGDALGVPVEFSRRAERIKSPVRGMTGYGTYSQPPGTWSDDSSLTLCLAESMCAGFSPEAIAESFCRWFRQAFWTPHGEVFDIGNATREAINRLLRGVPPLEAGGTREQSNGNGSLMRILPVAFYHKTLELSSLIQRTHQVSRITHAHPRSQMACGIYISIAACLLRGLAPKQAYLEGGQNVREIYSQPPYASELANFKRIFSGKLDELPEKEIQSDGYVISTLEASLWCLLNSSSYAEAVLKAVNLGGDTDTTGAVTGGLAGIFYGFDSIPQEWVAQIARKDDIIELSSRLEAALYSS